MYRKPLIAASMLLLGLAAGPAFGDERVPLIGNANLPVAGTGAPMARQNVTHLLVGELGYYRVADMRDRVLTRTQLRELLKQRAGTARPSPHEVWITAHKDAIWARVRVARHLCQEVGLYRVGLRIRHETEPKILGFPLFLPAGGSTARPGKASRLPVVLEAKAEEPSSDVRILYQAAKSARERYKQDVVAEMRIHNNVRVQTVLTALDMLYRGGCIGVSIKSLRNVPTTAVAPHVGVRIVRHPRARDVILPEKPITAIEVPPVAARTQPWPIDGANQPGALGMELLELPVRGETQPRIVEDVSKPLPFYLRRGGVPPAEQRLAESRLRGWSTYLGQEILAGVRRDGRVAQQVVVRQRELTKLSDLMTPVERAFRDAEAIRVGTMKVDVLLSRGGRPVGLFELELLMGPAQVAFVTMRSLPGEIPPDVVLPPEAVDPYAAATPGRLRVWIEAQMAAIRQRGEAAVTLAPERDVLAGCPAARQAALRQELATRRGEVQRAVRTIRALSFDRAFITVRNAMATVTAKGQVVGRIDLGIEAEEGELRINRMTPLRGR
ncbi:MAG: hypothetical protein QNJ98_17050 [Planctomycetota bacterium]|nr:hypothetical protein [Planctomycetota bacterium]